MWNLKRPCSNCPFLKSAFKGWLGRGRAREIIEAMTGGEHLSFFCHKTTVSSEADRKAVETSQHCAGAAILLHKTQQPNMAMRFGYAFKDFDGGKALENQEEVFETEEEFINHHDWENKGETNL